MWPGSRLRAPSRSSTSRRNVGGRHHYAASILDPSVDVLDAFSSVSFDPAKFIQRGGAYEPSDLVRIGERRITISGLNGVAP